MHCSLMAEMKFHYIEPSPGKPRLKETKEAYHSLACISPRVDLRDVMAMAVV